MYPTSWSTVSRNPIFSWYICCIFALYFRCLMIQVLTFGHPQICSNLPNRASSCCSLSSLKQKKAAHSRSGFWMTRILFWSVSPLLRSFRSWSQHNMLRHLHPILTPWVTCASASQIWVGLDMETIHRCCCWNRSGAGGHQALCYGFLYVFITLKVKRVLGSSCGYGMVSCSYVWS